MDVYTSLKSIHWADCPKMWGSHKLVMEGWRNERMHEKKNIYMSEARYWYGGWTSDLWEQWLIKYKLLGYRVWLASFNICLMHLPSACLLRHLSKKMPKLCHWPLWWESTDDRWIILTKCQWRGKYFHFLTSSWDTSFHDTILLFHQMHRCLVYISSGSQGTLSRPI